MRKLPTSKKIYIAHSRIANAGRGVFATQSIKRMEIIEVCPVILISKNDVSNLKGSILVNYYFYFGKDNEMLAIALGFGSIYNHSYEPNATYKKKSGDKVIDFVAIKNIKKGEEITINYNYGNPKDKTNSGVNGVPPYEGR